MATFYRIVRCPPSFHRTISFDGAQIACAVVQMQCQLAKKPAKLCENGAAKELGNKLDERNENRPGRRRQPRVAPDGPPVCIEQGAGLAHHRGFDRRGRPHCGRGARAGAATPDSDRPEHARHGRHGRSRTTAPELPRHPHLAADGECAKCHPPARQRTRHRFHGKADHGDAHPSVDRQTARRRLG